MFQNKKQKGILCILLIFLSLILAFNLTPTFNENSVDTNRIDQMNTPFRDLDLKISDTLINQYSGIGKAQNITRSGTGHFLNYGLNITNNENASIIIPNEWEGEEVLINTTNIYEYNGVFMNESFDNGIDYNKWTNSTTGNPNKFTVGYYNNTSGYDDSIYMQLDEDGGNWQNTYSIINYSVPIPRKKIPYQNWYFTYSVKWEMSDDSWRVAYPPGSKYVVGFVFSFAGGSTVSREFNLVRPVDIVNNTWYTETLSELIFPFTPEFYGFDLPANVSIYFSYGVKDSAFNPVGSLKIFYDNISFLIQSIPRLTDINLTLSDNDVSGLKDQPFTDYLTDFGLGYLSLDGSWLGSSGGETHEFSFSSNSTGIIILDSDFFVDATSLTETTTNLGFTGSEFLVQNGTKTTWTMYAPISIPGTYSDNFYFNLSKPINWNVTQALNPYEADKINEILGAGYGNSTLVIPEGIINSGVWKIVAEAPNYISESNLYKKNGLNWEINNIFKILDKLKINSTILTELIPNIDQTNASLEIFYPNGTLFYAENASVSASGEVEFSEIVLGANNASVGKYIANIKWNDFDSNMSQVGFYSIEFTVFHQSNLTAVTSYFEELAGDPLLIKVKFVDSDLNTSIPFATITYNSTFASFGTMVYQGLGVYFSEIDTNSLGLGDYYFSFNASKSYYQNQTSINLIHLKILGQPLALEVPKTAIDGIGNDYISFHVNVTGSISGVMILNATLSTNWQNPYTVKDHDNGTFTLNFSTWDLPTQGIIETYTVSINANKTNYGEVTSFIAMIIYPIQTIINVNSSVTYAQINEIVDIKLNYTSEESGLKIQEFNYSIVWSSLFNVIPDDDGIIIQLNTINLSVDTYTAIIKVEKVGYETAFKTITVIIDYIDIEITTINFQDSVETITGKPSVIAIKLTEPYNNLNIDNASVFYSWEFGVGYFNFLYNGTYELVLNVPRTARGNYKMTLILSKEDSNYKTSKFSFIIGIEIPNQSNSYLWPILITLIAVISVLGIVSLRSYVFLPLKRRKLFTLLSNTQNYKDIMNIETILISEQRSGLHLYSKSFHLLKNYQNELLTGFIQAITLMSNEIVGKENIEQITVKSDKIKGKEKIIELDFKQFNFFISEYKNLRIVFILKDKASERFKNKTTEFLLSLDQQVSDKFKGWDGSLEIFNKVIPPYIEKHFRLYYREKFKINPVFNIPLIIKEKELTKVEGRVLNVIVSMTKDQEEFYLEEAVNTVYGENKNRIIEALEALIERQIVISSISNNLNYT